MEGFEFILLWIVATVTIIVATIAVILHKIEIKEFIAIVGILIVCLYTITSAYKKRNN